MFSCFLRDAKSLDVLERRFDQDEAALLKLKTTYHLLHLLRLKNFFSNIIRSVLVLWLLLLYNFIQQSLNSGSTQVHTLLAVCRKF